jgi:hypothetical protein
MTLDGIRKTIDSERAILVPLKEKVTSAYLKYQCQNALYYLDDWEYFCFEGGLTDPTAYLDDATTFLQIASNQRKAVEDRVSKFGYDAVAVPYDLRRR